MFKFTTSLFHVLALSLLCLVFAIPNVQAQAISSTTTGEGGKWRIGLGVGPSLFFGDVKQYPYYPVTNFENEWRIGGNVLLERELSPAVSLRGQGLYAQMAGTRRPWNVYFTSDLIEFNLNATINLNNLFGHKRNDRMINFKVLFGMGMANYNTTLYQLGSNKVLAKRGFGNGSGIGGRTLEGIVLGGFGVDVRLNEHWSVNLETANRMIGDDLFDTWKSSFPFDVYNQTYIGIAYRFGRSSSRVGRLAPEDDAPVKPVVERQEVQHKENLDVLELDFRVFPAQPDSQIVKKDLAPVEKEKAEIVPVIIPEKPAQQTASVEYRVQIRAKFGNQVSVAELSRKYKIPADEIRENQHNGFYIYTVGAFSTYQEAADKRNNVRNVNGVFDAFVVAFKDGSRLDKLP
ncbi:MAG: hypothetical protein KGZ82_02225 [Bacteroidales bacterium]|nr:hypothetical protein [Bacteroidales bacterium]